MGSKTGNGTCASGPDQWGFAQPDRARAAAL